MICVFWDVTPYCWIPGIPKERSAFIFEGQTFEEFFLGSWTLPLGPVTHADTAITFLENVGSHYQRQNFRSQKTWQLKTWTHRAKLSLDLACSVRTTIAKMANENPRNIRNKKIVLSSYSGIMHRVSKQTKWQEILNEFVNSYCFTNC